MEEKDVEKDKDYFQVSLKLILKNQDNDTLLLKGTASDGPFKDTYDLPGGRIDNHEVDKGLMDILKREIAEEIGQPEIKINSKPVAACKFLYDHRVDHRDMPLRIIYLFFEGTLQHGEIELSDEHSELKWVKLTPDIINTEVAAPLREGLIQYIS